MPSLVLTECIDRFVCWTALNRAPKTAAHYRYQLDRFARWCNLGRTPIHASELSPALVSTYSRAYHPVQSVQRLCNWLFREERSIAANPLHGMAKPRCGERRRILSRVDAVRLLRAADPCFRAFLLLLRESMCRPQEARGLKWDDLADDAASPRFELVDAKGFDRRAADAGLRVIPVSPRLSRLLDRLRRRRLLAIGPVLTDSRGRPWSANAVRCRFRRLRVRLHLVADRRGERIVPYSFRHTGATAAVRAGIRDFRLASVLGHASTRTTARYVHPTPADVVDSMKCLWELKTARTPKNDRPGSTEKRLD